MQVYSISSLTQQENEMSILGVSASWQIDSQVARLISGRQSHFGKKNF